MSAKVMMPGLSSAGSEKPDNELMKSLLLTTAAVEKFANIYSSNPRILI